MMPKDNSEYRDYSIHYTEADGTLCKWYGSEETLLREQPTVTIVKKRKLRSGWRSSTKIKY